VRELFAKALDIPGMDAASALSRLAIFCALVWAVRFTRRWPGLFILLTLIGTAAHELLHAFSGLLFAAKPVSLSVIPRRQPDGGWLLGHVHFANLRWWNKLQVGLAPLALVPLGVWFFWRSIPLPLLSWHNVAYTLAAMQCVFSAWPSRQDWVHGLVGFLSLLLISAIILFFMVRAGWSL